MQTPHEGSLITKAELVELTEDLLKVMHESGPMVAGHDVLMRMQNNSDLKDG